MEQVNFKEIQRTILSVFRNKNTLSYLKEGLSKEKILKIILNRRNIENDPEFENHFLLIFPKLLKKGLIKREFGTNQYYITETGKAFFSSVDKNTASSFLQLDDLALIGLAIALENRLRVPVKSIDLTGIVPQNFAKAIAEDINYLCDHRSFEPSCIAYMLREIVSDRYQ